MNRIVSVLVSGLITTIALMAMLLPVSVSALDFKSNPRYSSMDQQEDVRRESDDDSGPFDGFDLKTRKVWINDMVYRMHPRMRVVGTAKKLGLLSDIKQGEIVSITVIPTDTESSIPVLAEIRRR